MVRHLKEPFALTQMKSIKLGCMHIEQRVSACKKKRRVNMSGEEKSVPTEQLAALVGVVIRADDTILDDMKMYIRMLRNAYPVQIFYQLAVLKKRQWMVTF